MDKKVTFRELRLILACAMRRYLLFALLMLVCAAVPVIVALIFAAIGA